MSYFSYGWTQNLVRSLNSYIPDCKILVIDNNPSVCDTEERAKSFIDSRNSIYKNVENSHKSCCIERNFLNMFENIVVLQTPLRYSHGQSLDMAIAYTYENKYKYFVHIEPDCLIKGSQWLNNLLRCVEDGSWMAGVNILPSWHIHLTPSIWNIQKIHNISFQSIAITTEKEDKIFSKIYNINFYNSNKVYDFNKVFFDTGVKAWYECAKNQKTQLCFAPDFEHLWAKSSSKFPNTLFL